MKLHELPDMIPSVVDAKYDYVILHNKWNGDAKISFEDLCKAIAKQLAKDGAIPFQED